ncbi:MAG: xanthine dehydrogenase family protein subunit M [Deltaproteobacteria bacterium]|nr:xanthine dehydrogenase family protein subunit M [Deltaproteobacteria bacterium]
MEFLRPASIQEAVEALAVRQGRARVLAGGTDLVVRMKDGLETTRSLVCLGRCVELRGVREEPDQIVIGAMTTHEELARSMFLRRVAPVLAEAAAEVGSVQIRQRGTIGGNVVNASPSADLVPPLHVLGALAVLVSRAGIRPVGIEELATGPKQTRIRPDELLTELRFPRPRPDELQRYLKLGQRRALACAKVSLAFRARSTSGVLRDVRIACGAVAPTVVRAREAERALEGTLPTADAIGRACAALARDIRPIDDVRSTAAWRLAACAELLRRALPGPV